MNNCFICGEEIIEYKPGFVICKKCSKEMLESNEVDLYEEFKELADLKGEPDFETSELFSGEDIFQIDKQIEK